VIHLSSNLLLTLAPQKRVATLVAVDETGRSTDVTMAELSRPRRQFEEDAKKNNKPSGRKLKEKNKKKDAKLTNWAHPFIWPQIVTARACAGNWKPRTIVKEARKLNAGVFWRLTEQVVGRWIDRSGLESKWKASILRKAEHLKGNSPGGATTRTGILVSLELLCAVSVLIIFSITTRIYGRRLTTISPPSAMLVLP
jgi:hypothetical protein